MQVLPSKPNTNREYAYVSPMCAYIPYTHREGSQLASRCVKTVPVSRRDPRPCDLLYEDDGGATAILVPPRSCMSHMLICVFTYCMVDSG
mgnify:CR=1 FL=1